MPIFAQYDFNDTDTVLNDSATANGAQYGTYLNGASAMAGQAVLDGVNDIIKIYPSQTFQTNTGTLDIQFTTSSTAPTGVQTLLSRDAVGVSDGGYHIDILPDGGVQIVHESPAGSQTFGTPTGFVAPGDEVKLTYSWDVINGGQLQVVNLTDGSTFAAPVPAGLTMDQSSANMDQPWIIGAGQSLSNPELLNNINQFFAGTVTNFTLSDTVDNLDGRDGYVDGTPGDDLIDVNYLGDPDGDRIDRNDAILPGTAPNDDWVRAGAGNDTVIAGVGDDTVYGGTGDDSLFGDQGNDVLLGEAGNDSLFGGAGNDVLLGGAGNDVVDGGAGDDSINTEGPTSSPDRAYPGLYPADANPNDDRDLVNAGAGNDFIVTGDDADTIFGGTGNDSIFGGDDDDSINGDEGDDSIEAGEGADTVFGGAGDDVIYGEDVRFVPGPTFLPDAVDLDPTNNTDSLVGGAGNDSIYGGDDDDTLSGGIGNDLLDGGIDEDLINGDAGNDTLIGGDGADTMTGGGDRDVILGATIGDVIDGSENGDDFDTLDLRGLGPLSVAYDPTNAENGTVTFLDVAGVPLGTASFVNIENVLTDPIGPRDGYVDGTAGNDLIDTAYLGDPDGDRIDSNDALLPGDAPNDDRVRAGAGDDTVVAGAGDDIVSGGTGNDSISGDAGDDTLLGEAGNDTLFGGSGDDSILGGDGNDVVEGGLGNDVIDTSGTTSSPDRTFPGLYTADANPNDDRDLVNAGAGNDVVNTGDDADTISGGAGDDTLLAGDDDDSVNGNDGDDLIEGGEGADTVFGDLGDDLIYGNSGGDASSPTLLVDAVDPDPTNDTDSLSGGLGNDTIFGGDDDDTLSGGFGDDLLYGGIDEDLIAGDAGNDTLVGGQGADTMIGGGDRDVILGASIGDVIDGSENGDDFDTLDLRGLGPLSVFFDPTNPENGTVTFLDAAGAPLGTASFVNIENVLTDPSEGRDGYVDGTSGNDLIDTSYVGDPDGDRIDANDAILPGDDPNDDRVRAGAGDDTILAGVGDDLVFGGAGNDVVDGGPGNDTLNGEDGNDTIIGGNGQDQAYGGDGNDVIDTSGGGTLPLPDVDYPGLYPADSNPTNDLDTVYGGAGDDTIRTGDDADLIYGGSGNDGVDGGIDNDTIDGGEGDDTLIGNEGADLITAGDGNDLVYGGLPTGILDSLNIPDATDLRPLNNIDTLYGGAGDDTIYGMDDNDNLFGGAGNDVLFGGVDNDAMFGDAGNDTLTGGEGLDNMSGGDDRDTFLIDTPTDGAGDVVDGNEGGDDFDTLDLRGSGPVQVVYDPTNDENGTVNFLDTDGNVTGSLQFTNIENVIPCFTPGTMIATPRGEVPVESLRPGDRVITRDNGIQEIRWTGSKAISWRDLTVNPHLKPILVRQGSLGNGLPERDMMVSPNHRLLVTNDRTALYFDEHEVLVAAKHLVSGKGVHEVDSIGTTYLHFMFDRHEVVLSNGAWTESFQPGDYTLKGMGNAQRNEIFELFPELKTEEGLENYGAARRTLKKHEARLLMK